VVDLNVRYEDKTNSANVAVVCELSKDKVTDPKGQPINVTDRGELQTLVDRGCAPSSACRATPRLPVCGTRFYKPRGISATQHVTEIKYVVVPYVPSRFRAF